MANDDPSNAVLAERIAEVKEDVRELQIYIRHAIERVDQQLVGSVTKHSDLDVKLQHEHDATVSLRAIVEYERSAHAKVHEDEHAWNRWVIGVFVAAITAAGGLGLGAWIVR